MKRRCCILDRWLAVRTSLATIYCHTSTPSRMWVSAGIDLANPHVGYRDSQVQISLTIRCARRSLHCCAAWFQASGHAENKILYGRRDLEGHVNAPKRARGVKVKETPGWPMGALPASDFLCWQAQGTDFSLNEDGTSLQGLGQRVRSFVSRLDPFP
jgi:hypothetical protein